MPALFLTSMPSGEHGDLDAIAALIDDGDDGDLDAPVREKRGKKARSSGLGALQVHMALSGLGKDSTASPKTERQQRSPNTMPTYPPPERDTCDDALTKTWSRRSSLRLPHTPTPQ